MSLNLALRAVSIAALIATGAGMAGCAKTDRLETSRMPLTRTGQPVDPQSAYAQAWPGKPGVYKISDQVILQIPPEFHRFDLQRHWLTGHDQVARPPVDLRRLETVPSISFTMLYPGFGGGFTPENFKQDFDDDRIQVIAIEPASLDEMKPGAPGYYPPNSFERFLKYSPRVKPDEFQTMHGLRCYDEQRNDNDRTCYGKRTSKADEYLMLAVNMPPYPAWVRYPLMRTTYFTPRYGGLHVTWWANMKHFAHWRQIDAAIWEKIDAWNIAPKR